jgi:hypothetical protein
MAMTDLKEHVELELAQRYATGALGDPEAAAFEEHLLTCQQCQDEVRLSVGIRRALRSSVVAAPRRRGGRVLAAAALAAAAAVLFVLPTFSNRELRSLGQVTTPPAYLDVGIRATPRSGDSLFTVAMSAYNAKRWNDATAGLRAALAAGVDTIPARFFLASASLMEGNPEEAASEYGLVIAAGRNAASYLDEARLFRARALLQLGRGRDALSELTSVQTSAAKSLADSVAKVIGR